jgi:4-hydroxy-tetrahydrodipicolinate synthase
MMLRGLFSAVLTPLCADGSPDHRALADHGRWLLAHGCDGLSVLGTTGEGNSFSVDERLEILERLVEAGIPGGRLLPGTGACAVPDAVRMTRRTAELGLAGALVLPPFYYKSVDDDGLFAAFAEVIERVGDGRLRLYLYHFPQMAGVALTPSLIERLLAAYPGIVVGIKDSSGDLDAMIGNARRFPGFEVLTGSDELLLPLLAAGGAGAITGVSNVAGFLGARVLDAWRRGDRAAAEQAQERLSAVRRAIARYPLTAALKEILAEHAGRAGWRRMRPPLRPLAAADAAQMMSALDRLGFRPPALP